MPTYEYACEKCGKNFDIFQSMRDEPFRECPQDHCQMETWGRGKVKRQLGTGAGLIFKGSGFYITDYRSKSYQDGAKKESPSADKPKTETKPAPSAKAETSKPPKPKE